jgi:hypothetical protein
MGSTSASYLGSVGRGGMSNQTTGSLQIGRAQREMGPRLRDRRMRQTSLLEGFGMESPFRMPATLLEQARTIPQQTYGMRIQNG